MEGGTNETKLIKLMFPRERYAPVSAEWIIAYIIKEIVDAGDCYNARIGVDRWIRLMGRPPFQLRWDELDL